MADPASESDAAYTETTAAASSEAATPETTATASSTAGGDQLNETLVIDEIDVANENALDNQQNESADNVNDADDSIAVDDRNTADESNATDYGNAADDSNAADESLHFDDVTRLDDTQIDESPQDQSAIAHLGVDLESENNTSALAINTANTDLANTDLPKTDIANTDFANTDNADFANTNYTNIASTDLANSAIGNGNLVTGGKTNRGFVADEEVKKPTVKVSLGDVDLNDEDDSNSSPDGNSPSEAENKGGEDGKDAKAKEEKTPTPMVTFTQLFRFARSLDLLLIFLGTAASALVGAGMPFSFFIFGGAINSFVDNGKLANFLKDLDFSAYNLTMNDIMSQPEKLLAVLTNCTTLPTINGSAINCSTLLGEIENFLSEGILDQMLVKVYYYIALAGIIFVAGYLQMGFWQHAAERQIATIRHRFLRSILSQNISWFDSNPTGELSSRLADDISKIREGIGGKLGRLMQILSQTIAGFVLGFLYSWKLSLVIIGTSPILIVCGFVIGKIMASFASMETGAYAKAGAVAEQAISCIRTVAAFGGQDKEAAKYDEKLAEAEKKGISKALLTGVSIGVTMLVLFGSYALAFWYGASMVRDGEISAGDIVVVFFSVLVAAFSIGQAGPTLADVATARGAAHKLFEIIDRKPEITDPERRNSGSMSGSSSFTSSSSPSAPPPKRLKGDIHFSSVCFSYPTRSEVPVLRQLSFSASSGQRIALVGASGCGKSTVLQLLQRFYDVAEGGVAVDGKDIRDYKLRDLRWNIGLVSQEPILFATSIEENIRLGNPSASLEDIQAAAKAANAFEFVNQLPAKFKTLVGERGAQLSGGQKQRIAIARALVRNPPILLLDEATSALDLESESIVQDALQKAQEGRTTIVVAHRLSTIKNSDLIFAFKDGGIVESGNHEQLMEIQGGVYKQLVESQTFKDDEGDADAVDDVFEENNAAAAEAAKMPTSKKRRKSSVKKTLSKAKKSLTESFSNKNFGYKDIDHSPLTEEDDVEEEEAKPEEASPSMWRLYKMNMEEWAYLLLGAIGSTMLGTTSPLFAIAFSEVLSVFSIVDPEESKKESLFWSLMFLVVGGTHFVGHLLATGLFGIAGEKLTRRVRYLSFKAILRQEMAYFDDKANSTGALCARLASDASQVKGGVGRQLGMTLQQLVNIVASLTIAFHSNWQLTLVILAYTPFLVLGGFLHMKYLTNKNEKDKKSLEAATESAVEAIENIRTVASLGQENHFISRYEKSIDAIADNAVKSAHVGGLAHGFSQSVIYFAYAGAFTYGAYLIQNGLTDFVSFMRVFSVVVFGAMAVGQLSSLAPEIAKAKQASAWVFAILDRVPLIPLENMEGKQLSRGLTGELQAEAVDFSYPNRRAVRVLKDLSLKIKPNQTVAIVGGSGSGKSTIIQLLERFYDPAAGSIKIDNHDLKELNLQWYRSTIGLVSQEPILFDCSLAENIAYGLQDSGEDIEMSSVIEAARQANIHDFITGLPDGYQTRVGEKGAQLSGGQKQRVAIARAIIRKPKSLLLDEATSALDNASEGIVQAALDAARSGRTCVVVAHRLSTIRDADVIVVLKDGAIVEEGNHVKLMAAKGHYYKLQAANVSL